VSPGFSRYSSRIQGSGLRRTANCLYDIVCRKKPVKHHDELPAHSSGADNTREGFETNCIDNSWFQFIQLTLANHFWNLGTSYSFFKSFECRFNSTSKTESRTCSKKKFICGY